MRTTRLRMSYLNIWKMEVLSKRIKRVYFLGIGGIGMSALARYFKYCGYEVAGYDAISSPLTRSLEREGMYVNYEDEEKTVPGDYLDPRTTLCIYTPAIPRESVQISVFDSRGFRLYKRAEVLGILSRMKKAVCVAGTHGKTTVSAMTAFLLKNSSVGCNAFLGGISVNMGTNMLVDEHSDYMVVEADEFDRSFLHLDPEHAVITAMDADHLDIYGDCENMRRAFADFASRIRPGGHLYLKRGLELPEADVWGYYGMDSGECRAENIVLRNRRYRFDYRREGILIRDIELGIPGRINIENAVAAITLALDSGVKPEEILPAMAAFRGVVRRFQIIAEYDDTVYIDDYAHHPREIESVLSSVREIWKEQSLTVVFQPHLYTRTRDFYKEFAGSLNLADEVVLLDIYPAREQPLPGVSSRMIADLLDVPVSIMSKEEVLEYAGNKRGVIITMGAGNIDRLVPAITAALERRYP